ncbi:penicillin-binding protein 1A [Alysiella filiformis]|uniref:Penicillin-binding protein 1A n=1 Tax=Alysiella filiformis DSM 16848 TaxID=1120981 RepID=A0A286EHM7_9NEIS|nr:penicillin-binding protein 1A [Alysiella filiformis]QMT32328.1 penicillin-binding protein 1A [Alysiella filiformis]UBQ56752.1 penicillin-binding protein 1A [Alysiella filiformis DSM 16848]SOD70294.1 penicillin-binding protein 1A [Alysiella filiformis DSM 16848]
MIKNFIYTILGLFLGLFLFAVGLVTVAVLVTYPKLPELDAVKYYQPKEPLTIYSSDGVIIGTYGDERREFRNINEFPQNLKNAVLAAEDKRFYEHWGVDVIGVARAIIGNLTGGVRSGASTITQQVARNFYLTNEQTITRKFNEALLAYKIERTLTKDQILELYFNQIYLGQRAYGFAAASKIYFNKNVQDLTLAEATILAGLPKAPSAFNPIVNPTRARVRQEYILNNMLDLNMITPAQRQEAWNAELIYERHRMQINQDALYVAEMARQYLYEKYGEDIYTQGFKVYTTVSIEHQKVATAALRKALRNFPSKGYRGAEAQLDLSKMEDVELELEQYLSNTYTVTGMIPAVITEIKGNSMEVLFQGGKKATLPKHAGVNNKHLGNNALKVGSVIRVAYDGNRPYVTQQPEIQGALVSMDTETGAIRAMVGGYDFHSKAFNRATQSIRQPGSTFKPFVYSAALSKGLRADTLVNDAPFTYRGWSPKNSDGYYAGMIPLRTALMKSKNVVSVRLAHAMGVSYVHRYVQRFGFRPEQVPQSLSLALGSGSATPLQMAEGYATFANGGYKVTGYVVDKIYDTKGNLRAEMQPMVARQNAQQIIEPRNAYVMTSMLQDVIRSGTATRANALGRRDLAGKTGTTNDAKDVWFVGYNPKIVTAVYMGYDTPRSMGRVFGGTLALPIWMDYMRFALKGMPDKGFPAPKGNVQQNIKPQITVDNSTDNPNAVRQAPARTTQNEEENDGQVNDDNSNDKDDKTDSLF